MENEDQSRKHRFITILYQVCGIPQKGVTVVNVGDEKENAYKERFMNEASCMKSFLDINAFIGVLVVVFLIGYFH